MSFRGKFKGAKLSAIKDVQKDAESNKKNFYESDGRVGFLDVDDGRNVFRIMPPHPDSESKSPYLPCRRVMLKCEVDIYKDGEPTGETEVKNKYIFIATQHGGLPKDPVEMYIDFVRARAEDEFSEKTDKQKFLAPITGWKDKKGNWNWGITPKTTFVAYAIKDGKFGRFELWESWIKEMDKLAINDSADQVIDLDPFSDPDEGIPLVITKQKNEKGKNEYIISKDEPSRAKRESWEDFFQRSRVTDEQLKELMDQKPLSEMYGKNVYTTRDFNLALDGLRRFDEEFKFNIFDNEEFLSELEAISKLVPKPKDKDDGVREAFGMKKGKDVEKESIDTPKLEEDGDSDELDLPTIKRELKKFIKKEYGEGFVTQLPKDTKTLMIWWGLYEEGDDLPIGDIDEPEVESTPAKIVPPVQDKKEKKEPKPVVKEVEESGSVDDDELSAEIAKLRARRSRS